MTQSGDEPITLGDRYELGGLLGRGGMADVRLGRDLRLGRTVAIKQLRADLASDDTFQARFRREAQSAAALNHPAIVAVYDTGETTDIHGNHIPYIVMEYVEGQTLREVLRDDRKILPERALSITADILSALDYSHRSGIIHRDIKPANVMLTPSGQVKVMDFGIARAIADASSAMTQTAAVIGTAQYLSPEQARGETVDARSDIYSTGCLLYELLTGRPPFVGDSPVSVAYQHVREEARPPSQLNHDVSSTVDNIVATSLAKRTDDRYQSAADMRRDIERAIAGQSVAAPTTAATAVAGATAVVPAAAAAGAGGATGTHAAVKDDDESGGGKGKYWALAIIAVLLVAGVAFAIYQSSRPEPVQQVRVTDVTGQNVDEATAALRDAGFEVRTEERADNDAEPDTVLAQDPAGGERVDEGSEITLTVSSGPEQVTVPDLENLTYDEASQNLADMGLRAKREDRDSSEPQNTVINSNPPAGTRLDSGSTVTLLVSRGEVTVPNVVGRNIDDARSTLEDAGFKVRTTDDDATTAAEDTVTEQSVAAGQSASRGSTITLTVSTGAGASPSTETPADPGQDAGGGGDDGDGGLLGG